MTDETYSAFEIKGDLIKAKENLDYAAIKIMKNGKRYEYSKEIISSYKSIAKEIMLNAKELRKIINKMKVFDEKAFKKRARELDRRVDII